ncbi:uncharacterized protein LOC131690884 [Topomyia yanbarensis]|uniref:uncharacterized protein LOC131690882 n=1 Tax=Topomyia yanbarensis TaxID=2498891 RepID=UPI00273B30DD|nr:uncharacterized protein LOC131690882 [Topomyia yanbarensis]XP_058832939.1 uncharacterized protein LOC131690884 [Topomyia yanbarensis]
MVLTTVSGNRILSVTKFQTGTCTEEGIICFDCKTPAQCVFVNNGWRPMPFDDCDADEGYFCNVHDGGCSQRVGPCNPAGQDGNFVCNTVGVFPDPFDCQIYHMCYQNGQNLVAINMGCDNTAFSPATGDCSLPRNDSICATLQWNCTQAGEMNAWPGNNNIYYLCVAGVSNGIRVYYPELFRCNANQVFSGGRCVDRQTVPSLPEDDDSYICDSPGLFPDSNNCRFYYSCDGNLNSQHLECPAGTFFKPETVECVTGTC